MFRARVSRPMGNGRILTGRGQVNLKLSTFDKLSLLTKTNNKQVWK